MAEIAFPRTPNFKMFLGRMQSNTSCINMDPGQDLQRKFLFKLFREILNVGSEMPGHSENHFAHLELLRDKNFELTDEHAMFSIPKPIS